MAGRKPSFKKRKSAKAKKSTARSLWKGSISFGLVNIPVALHPAESSNELDFKLLDRRNFSPVRYRRINEKTGQEVPWNQIIKGYEYEKGEYVGLTDADFEKANIKATHVIEITDFVDAAEISPIYYDRPYYLQPLKDAEKSYALLRDVLRRTKQIGIGKIVIRSRQRLAAVIPIRVFLVVNLLRFPHELRDAGFEVSAAGPKVEGKELKLAERLVDSMKGKWYPEKYRDDYRDDLKKHIENKIKTGETQTVDERPLKARSGKRAQVIDMMDLLKRSVERTRKAQDQPRKRKAS